MMRKTSQITSVLPNDYANKMMRMFLARQNKNALGFCVCVCVINLILFENSSFLHNYNIRRWHNR